MTKKAAILPTVSIGDAVLMMIVCYHLKKLNYDITIYHDSLITFQNWCPKYNLKKYCSHLNFSYYDLIIMQNDNKQKVKNFKKLRKEKKLKNLSIVYFSYKKSKHGNLDSKDIVLNEQFTIVEALSKACQNYFKTNYSSNTGIEVPKNLKHKKYKNRVVIHPTSGSHLKNWSKHKFIKLAVKLKKRGFDPVITVSSEEIKDWKEVLKHNISLPLLPNISDLSTYIYESSYFIGNDSLAGHLASYFEIPSIIVASNRKQMISWQPGWQKAKLIFPPLWLLNTKYLRLKEKYWQPFISVNKVFRSFKSITTR